MQAVCYRDANAVLCLLCTPSPSSNKHARSTDLIHKVRLGAAGQRALERGPQALRLGRVRRRGGVQVEGALDAQRDGVHAAIDERPGLVGACGVGQEGREQDSWWPSLFAQTLAFEAQQHCPCTALSALRKQRVA